LGASFRPYLTVIKVEVIWIGVVSHLFLYSGKKQAEIARQALHSIC